MLALNRNTGNSDMLKRKRKMSPFWENVWFDLVSEF